MSKEKQTILDRGIRKKQKVNVSPLPSVDGEIMGADFEEGTVFVVIKVNADHVIEREEVITRVTR